MTGVPGTARRVIGPRWRFLLPAILVILSAAAPARAEITVGSKKFTESVILGEIIAGLGRAGGHEMQHLRELGGTRVLWDSLRLGEIDIYPEYTGTLLREILAREEIATIEELRARLAEDGIAMTAPLGFDNGYALGIRQALAQRENISSISDLRAYPDLVFGFGNEFMNRADGWPGLRRAYGLPQDDVRGLDHDLAYIGLAEEALDLIDVYTTDAEIAQYDIRVLEDDRAFFVRYEAVILYREALAATAPALVDAIRGLAGRIPAPEMIAMNVAAKLDGEPESAIAARFLQERFKIEAPVRASGFWTRFWQTTRDHFVLVGISLGAAIFVALPLGVLAYQSAAAGRIILSVVGVIQTIPSLALFVFMIPLLGIGGAPAIAALFLYSLLPIVRNTHTGLANIPLELRESALALGLRAGARLRLVALPLALPAILAGIKTSAVINVGTATLGALIGAGGYGQPILTGIRLNDTALIMEGAIPAALLALGAQLAFDVLERRLVPRGLRLG